MFGLLKRLVTDAESIALRPRDCHTHVIPGVDDGSRNMDQSLAMLALLKGSGAQVIVSTSHIYAARFPNEPDDLKRGFERVERAREQAGIEVELSLGAEHFLDESFLPRISRGDVLDFGPERYVLFETHTGDQPPVDLMAAVHDLRDRGYTPLLAHVERYPYLRGPEGDELCHDLRNAGARFQVNRTVGRANVPGRGHRGRFLSVLLERGWVDEVGSDLHRPTAEGRPQRLVS